MTPEVNSTPEISILYVEDEPDTREILTTLLARIVSTLYVAENGEVGLALYKEHRPDIVITDINMPVMNGIQMVKEIKLLNPEAVVIALTACSASEYLLDAIRAGISNYVLKPIDLDKLFEVIAKSIEAITMKKKIQEQNDYILQLSRAVEENPCAVVITDRDGLITYVNPKFTEMTGYRANEVIGRNPRILKSNRMPLQTYGELWSAITSGQEWRGELLNRRKNGEIYWESASISPILNSEGSITNFVAVKEDITERKRSEEALRQSEENYRRIFSSLQEGFCLLDIIYRPSGAPEDYRYREVNAAYERIIGINSDALVGRTVREVFPQIEESWLKFYAEVALTGNPATMESHAGRHDRAVEVHACSPSKGRQIALVLADVTERRAIQEEREKAQRLESLGILAGGIAHDFNNILTAIIGNLSLAQMQLGEDHKAAARLEACESAIMRATDLTRQLLTFARGGAPIKKVIEVGRFLKAAADFALRGSSARCQFALADDLWLVEADEGQLSQVIHNLVSNAVHAMPEGGTVTLGAENVSGLRKGERLVRISVTDSGVGISEQDLPSIFDPYFSTKHKGSGLGLATCYSIIKRHGGNITVSSTLGKGSTFYVDLPASEQASFEPELKMEIVRGTGRILVMDDEESVRDAAAAMLEALGYTAECAENGNSAIDLYQERKKAGTAFNAVIMDLTVPGGMGGKEAIAFLLGIDPDIKGIVSSGYSDDPVMADFRRHGFSAMLRKPYRLQEMGKILQDLLENSAQL